MKTTATQFEGKSVLVTGAGKGIGRCIATELSKRGARVIALSRSVNDLESLREQINCEIKECDVSDADQIRSVFQELGDVNYLVNNAGISIPQSFIETKLEAFDQTIAVNLRASFVIAQEFVRRLVKSEIPGAIVNVSSQASMVGLQDHTAYCVSKGGLDQLTRVMAVELGKYGIRVNSVNPTVTMTPMGKMAWSEPTKSGPMLARIPLGHFAEPVDVANVVAFLLSDDAGMIHGTIVPVDGGFIAT